MGKQPRCDGLNPEQEFLNFAKPLGAFQLQFLFDAYVARSREGAGRYRVGSIKSGGFCYRMPK